MCALADCFLILIRARFCGILSQLLESGTKLMLDAQSNADKGELGADASQVVGVMALMIYELVTRE